MGQNGYADILFYGFRGFELHDRFLIEQRGHGQLPLLIAARVNVQGVHSLLLEVLRQLNALVKLTEAGIGNAVVGAELYHHGHIGSGAFAHRRDLLQQEGGAAPDVSAVLVRTGVPRGGQELVVQISAVGVHLIGVCAGGAGQPYGPLRLVKKSLYLLRGQLVAFYVGRVQPAARGGADGNRVHLGRTGHASAARHELHADLAARIVRPVADLLEVIEVVLSYDQRRGRVLEVVRDHHVHQYHGRAALGALDEILHGLASDLPEVGAHRRHNDTVFQLKLAYSARARNDWHTIRSFPDE